MNRGTASIGLLLALLVGCDDGGGTAGDDARPMAADAVVADGAAHDARLGDGETPPDARPDGARPPDEGVEVPDDGVEVPDEGIDPPDEGVEVPDEGVEVPDEGVEVPDEGIEVPDEGIEPLDAGPDGQPDATPDMALPDLALPDMALPDMALPDMALPDMALPDMAPPCDPGPPWSRRLPLVGGVVAFNELLVDPAGDRDDEWFELHNQLAVDIDISGWSVEGGIDFTFPEGTFIHGGEYLVVAAAPERLPNIEALGPYERRLSRSGERLSLRNNGGRLMDEVDYDDAFPWPQLAEGDGRSLAKADPDRASPPGEHWRPSAAPGGNPGVRNFPRRDAPATELVREDDRWRYDLDAPDGWQAVDYDDAAWAIGPGPLHAGPPGPKQVFVRASADELLAVYAGGADGSNLREVSDGAVDDWTIPGDFQVGLVPGERVYLLAWEPLGADGGPQMLVGQFREGGGSIVGTSAVTMEYVLGPEGAAADAPLSARALADAVEDANLRGAWRLPRAELPVDFAPWGDSLAPWFEFIANYIWTDRFDAVSETNERDTWALFRTRVTPTGQDEDGGTELPDETEVVAFRRVFDFAGDPAATELVLHARSADVVVAWLNGVEVHRQAVDAGPVTLEAPPLRLGRNVFAVEVRQADDGDPRLGFSATLHTRPQRGEAPPAPTHEARGVVINELMYNAWADGADWLELHNPGAEPVDLSGWQLVDAVEHTFPDGTVLAADGYLVVDDFAGGLGNRGERLELRDACGETVDAVRWYDGGRWSDWADGAGASLELRNPRIDNTSPDAWAPSDEAARSEWQEVRYRAVAAPSPVGPDGVWHELVVGMLAPGEVWLDDVSVVEDPDGAAVELIQDGRFDEGEARGWRIIGNHRHSEVIADPDDPDNGVLRLVATGAHTDKHNHAETTFADGRQVQNGVEYEVSYRGRWIGGAGLVNTRLYFLRLARTTRLGPAVPGGTPGERNSTYVDNLGPTFAAGAAALAHFPVVPAAGEPIEFVAQAADPDGLDAVTLWWAVEGQPFEAAPMARGDDGRYRVTLAGHDADTMLQVYVEATDALGASATFPVGGPESRALVKIDAENGGAGALRNLRIWMTADDTAFMHDVIELMSNDGGRATVVYDDRTIFYDVRVRLKGSQAGRPSQARLGFNVRYNADQQLRDVYGTTSIDRSEVAVGTGQREMLANVVLQRGGSVSAEYNDLVHLVPPRAAYVGPAELQLARFGDLMLANQWESGAQGHLYEYEVIYYPTTTVDGTPEGRKRPTPQRIAGTHFRDLGEDPEAYRFNYEVKNNRTSEDASGLIAFCQVMGLPEPEFRANVDAVIDVDDWLRQVAFAVVIGAVDSYAVGSQHNAQLYVRPGDQRVHYFPHDLDFYRDAFLPLAAQHDLRRLIAIPGNRRIYYGHLHDILERAFNDAYMSYWRDHFGGLLPEQQFANNHQFIVDRAQFIRVGAADSIEASFPRVDFAITTNGGADFETDVEVVQLEGVGWIDVRTITVDGVRPLPLTWLDDGTWQVAMGIAPGANEIELTALDRYGESVGSAGLTITLLDPPP